MKANSSTFSHGVKELQLSIRKTVTDASGNSKKVKILGFLDKDESAERIGMSMEIGSW